MAVGSTLLPALVGFFQGAAAVQARGLAASTLVPFTVEFGRETGVDVSWAAALYELVRRAADAGHSISARPGVLRR